mgnify:CR=1 FL=1|tara:strand:+ start:452 stop:733 length:282 start_codon:yes stop_codon:yes gene_type:complete
MRKIEQKLVNAINNGSDYWHGGNTTFTRDIKTGLGRVSLHGNHIADIDKDNKATANLECFYHWPTVTTRSRLRALGINASIKNFEACIDGIAI